VHRKLSSVIRRIQRAVLAELRAWATRGPVRDDTVLYESFAGNGALCNPEAIFRELLASADLSHLTHTWVLDSLKDHRAFQLEFASDPRVSFVRYRSARYFRALATRRYLVNNATFPAEFSKRPGQTYLNTWHGTPLKTMGYDMPDGAAQSSNTMRNFLSADYLLSQNRFMTDTMYANAYRLRGAFRGSIIEEGYPRVDRQFLDLDEFISVRARIEQAGIPLGDRKIVLFAPTWKGDSFSRPEDDSAALLETAANLQHELGHDKFVVLLKTHQVVHAFADSIAAGAQILVPNDIPTNSLLGVTSVLITDYSSVFFDFLASDRPIIFYVPGSELYSLERGTYFAESELPGPVCRSIQEAAKAVQTAVASNPHVNAHRSRARWAARFSPADDGGASRRVVDIVFRGARSGRVVSLVDDKRTPVLFHLGGMRSNGITTSALNLLRAINKEQFDVSVVFTRPRSREQWANQAQIDPDVRQFHRVGGMNGSKAAHLRRKIGQYLGRSDHHRDVSSLRRMWDNEWLRCFGDAQFVSVVDFSGYSAFWATLLLHSPSATRSVWLHNDMAAERHRVIRGAKRLRRGLGAVFALYPYYDRLVSVSPSLSELNRASLGQRYALPNESFVSARNVANAERVLAGLSEPLDSLPEFQRDIETNAVDTPPWAAAMANRDQAIWFATLGRFSTEKNHERLLRAFKLVHDVHPHVRLVIAGYGPLRHHLERVVADLHLQDVAFVVGPFGNPFPIIAAADCFVLSSDWEGQPMVLLEAAMARRPIVTVRFKSVDDALPGSQMLVVDQTATALAVGMLTYLDGRVQPAELDVGAYNREAIRELEVAIAPTPLDHGLAA
jgi:CDP-glycerol glycerophosphotransferase